jgi:hypothetical protein
VTARIEILAWLLDLRWPFFPLDSVPNLVNGEIEIQIEKTKKKYNT